MNELDQLKVAKRLLSLKEAKERMLPFMRLTMPDPSDPADIEKSRYVITPQAKLLCQIIEKMDTGKLTRVAVSIGPQMGKSQVLSRGGPAWLSGRDPYRNIMLGTYNQDFADDFGVDVRNIMDSDVYRHVFPDHELKKREVDHLMTKQGGKLAFIGVGGSGTGKPADFFFVDDPIRNDDDAQSDLYRERLYKWFNGVVFSRLHDKSAILIVHTRWHQDDLIGRLCDPDHPERNKRYAGIADDWTYINLPAVIEDPELAKALGLTLETPTDPKVVSAFGAKPMSALWPGRKSLPLLAEAKRGDNRIFGALYMGQPTPEDGDYFKLDQIVEYGENDLPKALHKYGASDHAVGVKQANDNTVMGVVGVDDNDDIWILPDLFMDRVQTDRTVEEMIALMKRHKPMMWWMESELISKSFGPFLRKRMQEERCYTYIDPVTVSADKMKRARAIQGRMSMRKVHFPRFAPWWAEAKGQLLKFPNGTHDDFVDFIAHIGQGLTKEIPADAGEKIGGEIMRPHSPKWIMAKAKERFANEGRSMKGW